MSIAAISFQMPLMVRHKPGDNRLNKLSPHGGLDLGVLDPCDLDQQEIGRGLDGAAIGPDLHLVKGIIAQEVELAGEVILDRV